MKKLFLVSLLLVGAGAVKADVPVLVNADGSDLSAICIAAVTSREAMHAKAIELGVQPLEPATLHCNGVPLSRFRSAYRASAEPKPRGFVFSKSDESPVTELCLAAVRSEQEYLSVKERHFGSDDTVEAEVHCNGIPVLAFARKYRAAAPAISSR